MPKFNRKVLTITLAVLLVATVLTAALMFEYYEPLYEETTGEPYTHIMRRNPWLLPAIAFPVMGAAVWRVPFQWWGRILLVWVVGGLWFLAGHIYWGGG